MLEKLFRFLFDLLSEPHRLPADGVFFSSNFWHSLCMWRIFVWGVATSHLLKPFSFAPSAYRADLISSNGCRWGIFCPTSVLPLDDSFQSWNSRFHFAFAYRLSHANLDISDTRLGLPFRLLLLKPIPPAYWYWNTLLWLFLSFPLSRKPQSIPSMIEIQLYKARKTMVLPVFAEVTGRTW